jgi:hypothetical protein
MAQQRDCYACEDGHRVALAPPQDAARKIGIGNSDAENLKSLLEPEEDIAGAEGIVLGSLMRSGFAALTVSPATARSMICSRSCSLPGGRRTLWITTKGFSSHGHPPFLSY